MFPLQLKLYYRLNQAGSIELAHIQVLPSVTQSHFVPYYQGPTDEPKVSLMINVDWEMSIFLLC